MFEDAVAKQLAGIAKHVEALLERIVKSDTPVVVKAYETEIAKLERNKLVLAEKTAQIVLPKGRLEEFIEPALHFLGNPWHLCENESLALKRTVMRTAFSEPLGSSRKNAYRAAEIAIAFKV